MAADGANSTIRKSADFGTTVTPLSNKFAWFGTTRVFETLTQTFVQNEAGTFNAHHYRHSPSMSTFVFECDAATWARAGFERMDEAQTLAVLRAGLRRRAAGPSPRVQQVRLAQLPQRAQPRTGRAATSC